MEQQAQNIMPKLIRRCFEHAPGQCVEKAGDYRCATCSTKVHFEHGEILPNCPLCGPHIRVWVGMRCAETQT